VKVEPGTTFPYEFEMKVDHHVEMEADYPSELEWACKRAGV
jgi:hypothetical protein